MTLCRFFLRYIFNIFLSYSLTELAYLRYTVRDAVRYVWKTCSPSGLYISQLVLVLGDFSITKKLLETRVTIWSGNSSGFFFFSKLYLICMGLKVRK